MVLVIWLNENVDKGYAIRDVAKLTGKGILESWHYAVFD